MRNNSEHSKIRENIKKVKKPLILEGINAFDVIDAIKNHKVIYIYYAGDDTVMKGYRTIEPYVLGTSTAGNTVLRAWQQAGASDSNRSIGRVKRPDHDHIPGWRLFNVEFITTIHDTGKRFSTEPSKIRPKYNPNDKQMTNIKIAVQSGEEISDFNVGTNKSYDDVIKQKSEFDKQSDLFKGFSRIDKKQELIKKTVFDLYEFITRYQKKRADNYIVVNKNGRIWIDSVKNKSNYSENDIYGNLKELYQKYSGNVKGSKEFFDKERKKFLNN